MSNNPNNPGSENIEAPNGQMETVAKIESVDGDMYLYLADVEANKQYSFRTWIQSSVVQSIKLVYFIDQGTTKLDEPDNQDEFYVIDEYDIITKGQWYEYKLTFTPENSGKLCLYFFPGTAIYYLWNSKLEEGNIFTDWSASEEEQLIFSTICYYISTINPDEAIINSPTQQVNSQTGKNVWSTIEPDTISLTEYIYICFEYLYADGHREWSVPIYNKNLTMSYHQAIISATTATNYMNFSSNSGLVVGHMNESDNGSMTGLATNVQIKVGPEINLRNNTTNLASFSSSAITFYNNDTGVNLHTASFTNNAVIFYGIDSTNQTAYKTADFTDSAVNFYSNNINNGSQVTIASFGPTGLILSDQNGSAYAMINNSSIKYGNNIVSSTEDIVSLIHKLDSDVSTVNMATINLATLIGDWDQIKSSNYTYTSGNFSSNGTSFNLNTGELKTPGFAVIPNSSSKTADVYVKGTIESNSGNIAGWTISKNGLYYNTTSISDTNSGIFLGKTGIRHYNNDNAYTDIKNGIITAKGVNISGTIMANNGSIGGININNNSLSMNNSGKGFSFYSNGSFWLGSSSSGINYDGSNISLSSNTLYFNNPLGNYIICNNTGLYIMNNASSTSSSSTEDGSMSLMEKEENNINKGYLRIDDTILSFNDNNNQEIASFGKEGVSLNSYPNNSTAQTYPTAIFNATGLSFNNIEMTGSGTYGTRQTANIDKTGFIFGTRYKNNLVSQLSSTKGSLSLKQLFPYGYEDSNKTEQQRQVLASEKDVNLLSLGDKEFSVKATDGTNLFFVDESGNSYFGDKMVDAGIAGLSTIPTGWTDSQSDIYYKKLYKLATVTNYYNNQSPSFTTTNPVIYKYANGAYTALTTQPTDWKDNYTSYYTAVAQNVYYPNTSSTYDKTVTYYRSNKEQFNVVSILRESYDNNQHLGQHFTFSEDSGMIVTGTMDNPDVKLRVTNDRISFEGANQEVAYISNDKLYINNAQIVEENIIGYYDPVDKEIIDNSNSINTTRRATLENGIYEYGSGGQYSGSSGIVGLWLTNNAINKLNAFYKVTITFEASLNTSASLYYYIGILGKNRSTNSYRMIASSMEEIYWTDWRSNTVTLSVLGYSNTYDLQMIAFENNSEVNSWDEYDENYNSDIAQQILLKIRNVTAQFTTTGGFSFQTRTNGNMAIKWIEK